MPTSEEDVRYSESDGQVKIALLQTIAATYYGDVALGRDLVTHGCSSIIFHEKTVGVVKNTPSPILKLQKLNEVQSSNGGLSLVGYITTCILFLAFLIHLCFPRRNLKPFFKHDFKSICTLFYQIFLQLSVPHIL